MEESLKLANKLETLALTTKNPVDWDNARKAIDLAWSLYKIQQQAETSPESDVEYVRRMV